MEVIFVKFKQNMQEAGWAMAEMTAAYSRWLEAQVRAIKTVTLKLTKYEYSALQHLHFFV